MKRVISTLLCAIALCALLCVSVLAETTEPDTFTSGDFEYILLPDGTAEIRKYTGTEKDLAIPVELDETKVSSIGDYAFSMCLSLISVTIPDNVTTIGDEAFFSVFNLTDVTIPDSVIAIGVNPFGYCSNLASIKVSPEHPVLAIIDGVLFSKPDKRLIYYPMSKINQNYIIPQGIAMIGERAFYNCEKLTSVTIPDSVTVIGDSAFDTCTSLTSISIPDSVIAIGSNPFINCENLASVLVSPDNPALAVIDGVLFSKTDKRLVWYPLTKTDQEYTIPRGITVIGNRAFAYCKNLSSISIPSSIIAIEDGAFLNCESLTSITIPDGVSTIGDSVFYRCKRLSYVSIPDSVIAIGNEAFFYCISLTSLSIPDNVTAIGNWAFYFCSSLTSISIPDSVIVIGNNPFIYCNHLASIRISPDHPGLEVIDDVLFSKTDKRLVWYPMTKTDQEYTIPQGIVEIGDWAFTSCKSLTSVSIPDSVTNIGDSAFYSCKNLLLSVPRDSYAAQYCKENNLNYTYPDSLDWLNQ